MYERGFCRKYDEWRPLLLRKGDRMTFTKVRFASFEEYLTADPFDLPEGRCEYWDGELVEVMSESLVNEAIANYLRTYALTEMD